MKKSTKLECTMPDWSKYRCKVLDIEQYEWQEMYKLEITTWYNKWKTSRLYEFDIDHTVKVLSN